MGWSFQTLGGPAQGGKALIGLWVRAHSPLVTGDTMESVGLMYLLQENAVHQKKCQLACKMKMYMTTCSDALDNCLLDKLIVYCRMT